jgi:Fe-S cluster assembly protein SufD
MDSAFGQSQIDQHGALAPELAGARHAWLAALRHEALDAFATRGLPDARDEHWKYSALRALAQRPRAPGDAGALARPIPGTTLSFPAEAVARLVFVHGVFRADLSTLGAGSEALTIAPLSAALEQDASGLRFFLSRHFREPHQGFARLNTAFASDGAVIRVAPGARIEQPVHLVFVGAPAESELAWYARNLIELGEGATLHVVEHYVGAGAHGQLGNVVNQVSLQAGARLAWLRAQEEDEGALLVGRSEFQLAARARLDLHQVELGAGSRTTISRSSSAATAPRSAPAVCSRCTGASTATARSRSRTPRATR